MTARARSARRPRSVPARSRTSTRREGAIRMSEARSPAGSWSPCEVLLLVLGLAAAAVSTVLWLGAMLAITVTGGSPAGLRWSDGLRAAVALADRPSDPSAAFADLPAGVVPGPWVFWPCVVVVAVLVVGVAVAARVAWRATAAGPASAWGRRAGSVCDAPGVAAAADPGASAGPVRDRPMGSVAGGDRVAPLGAGTVEGVALAAGARVGRGAPTP